MELATNFVLEKSNAGRTYSKMGVDAMFSLTACKVGLKKNARAGERGYGYPFIKHIPFQHLVLDMANAADEEVGIHRQSVSRAADVGERQLQLQEVGSRVADAERSSATRRRRDVNPEEFSRGGGWNVEEYTDHVDLWDYLASARTARRNRLGRESEVASTLSSGKDRNTALSFARFRRRAGQYPAARADAYLARYARSSTSFSTKPADKPSTKRRCSGRICNHSTTPIAFAMGKTK